MDKIKMIQRQLPVEELCRKLKPLFGDKIDNLYFRFSVSNSLEEKNEIFQMLTLLYQKNLNKLLDNQILLEPPEESQIKGEYSLAEVEYANKTLFQFGLKENDWPRHVCISGMSGSGKTNFAFNIIQNFIKMNKPFLVFDWKKSFRPLINLDSSLMCFTIGEKNVSNFFKVNINIPPQGVSPKEWINVLADLLTESFSASFGVHKILLETLDEIFEGWDIYKGSKHYPNWRHVKKMLEMKAKESNGRESKWYESALRIASVLTFGSFGDVINYEGKRSVSIEDLFDKRVVIELNSLGNIEKKFFSEFILTYIYKYKKSKQNKINEGFNYAILVDEAHNIFLKDKTHFVAESVTDMIYREMREYGISLICLDQHISKLSDTVKGNSACHIAFQQQLPQDIKEISSLMQLEQNRDYFSKLPVGYAIVKLSERFNSPFLVKVPFMELREDLVADDKLHQRMDCIVQGIDAEKNDDEFKESITFEREVESGKWGKCKLEKVNESVVSNVQPNELTEKQKILYDFMQQQLSEGRELNLIRDLFTQNLSEGGYTLDDVEKVFSYNPCDILDVDLGNLNEEQKRFVGFLINNGEHNYSTVELYGKMGFSPRKGNKIKDELLDRSLIEIKEEKNLHGWRKLIRLSNSYLSQNKSQENISINA